MENASKALIIAGAILLSILIIGLAMYIYDQAASATEGLNIDPQKVAAYNTEFENFEGTQSGTNVRDLCDKVRNHNNANIDDPSTQIRLVNSDASTIVEAPKDGDGGLSISDINTLKNTVKKGKTYTVTFGYDKNSGYIIAVGFVEKK